MPLIAALPEASWIDPDGFKKEGLRGGLIIPSKAKCVLGRLPQKAERLLGIDEIDWGD